MQNILFGTSCDSRNDHRYGIFLHFCLPSTEVLITLLKFFFYYLATKDCELGSWEHTDIFTVQYALIFLLCTFSTTKV